MKIYMSGPMRGITAFNFPAFDKAARQLREQGHTVFSPADADRQRGFEPAPDSTGNETDGFNLREALGADLAWIIEHADAVVTLDGWHNSKGALAEVATARALGLPVWPHNDVALYVDMLGGESANMETEDDDDDGPIAPWERVTPEQPTTARYWKRRGWIKKRDTKLEHDAEDAMNTAIIRARIARMECSANIARIPANVPSPVDEIAGCPLVGPCTCGWLVQRA